MAGLVVVGGVAAASYFYDRPTELRLAAAQGGEDFRLMTAAAQAFSRQHEPVRLKLVPLADAAASAAALEAGTVDLAVVHNDGNLPATAQAVAILHHNAALFIAPGGSSLRRIADLRGKKIGVVREDKGEDANARLLEVILAQYEVPQKSVAVTPVTPAQIRSAIEAHQIDAVFAVGAPDAKSARDIVSQIAASSAKPPVFLPISEAKAIAKRFPALEPTEIVRGAFGGDPPRPAEAYDSSSVSVLLVARSSLAKSLAGEVTRQIFADRAAIALAAPLANNIEAPSTDKGSVVTVHPGAADFLDGNEQGFFEKYSDFFYLGAMLLSFVGSAAAALAARLNVRTHERSEQLTERLLEILQAARTAATIAELDGYEREVDEVLVRSLADIRLRNVETSELHMVALALDQARLAIRDRRRILANDGEVVNFSRELSGRRNNPARFAAHASQGPGSAI